MNCLNLHGIKAAEVNGYSKDRDEILADFEAGEYDVLCNSMLLTEGLGFSGSRLHNRFKTYKD